MAEQGHRAGNNSATVKQLQSYLQSSSGDFGAIAKDAGAAVAAAEQGAAGPTKVTCCAWPMPSSG
jgi:hypothetical protein